MYNRRFKTLMAKLSRNAYYSSFINKKSLTAFSSHILQMYSSFKVLYSLFFHRPYVKVQSSFCNCHDGGKNYITHDVIKKIPPIRELWQENLSKRALRGTSLLRYLYIYAYLTIHLECIMYVDINQLL